MLHSDSELVLGSKSWKYELITDLMVLESSFEPIDYSNITLNWNIHIYLLNKYSLTASSLSSTVLEAESNSCE